MNKYRFNRGNLDNLREILKRYEKDEIRVVLSVLNESAYQQLIQTGSYIDLANDVLSYSDVFLSKFFNIKSPVICTYFVAYDVLEEVGLFENAMQYVDLKAGHKLIILIDDNTDLNTDRFLEADSDNWRDFKEVMDECMPYIPDDMSEIGEVYGDGYIPREVVDCWCTTEDFLSTISEEVSLTPVNIVVYKKLLKENVKICFDITEDESGLNFVEYLYNKGGVEGWT